MDLNGEKRDLIIVLTVFDLAYLGRMICAATIFKKAFSGKYASNPFIFKMATIGPAIFLDAIPIFLVACMHHANFKKTIRSG
jgi:hypothetical protein